MKSKKQMLKAFGVDAYGMPDVPAKFSNVRLSRTMYGNERGCSWCFPHGWETNNSTRFVNRQRSWKRFRKTHWKSR